MIYQKVVDKRGIIVSKMAINHKTKLEKDITFYHIIGEYDGRLIVSFNEEWNKK